MQASTYQHVELFTQFNLGPVKPDNAEIESAYEGDLLTAVLAKIPEGAQTFSPTFQDGEKSLPYFRVVDYDGIKVKVSCAKCVGGKSAGDYLLRATVRFAAN